MYSSENGLEESVETILEVERIDVLFKHNCFNVCLRKWSIRDCGVAS
jgi:hypothetical protein